MALTFVQWSPHAAEVPREAGTPESEIRAQSTREHMVWREQLFFVLGCTVMHRLTAYGLGASEEPRRAHFEDDGAQGASSGG
jgi:hypothetical protein